MGDMNARVQKARNSTEREHIGTHTSDRNNTNIDTRGDGVQENRDMFINLCVEHQLIAMNTQFPKTDDKLATYREPGTERDTEPSRQTHEQLDYITVTRRWRNMCKNAEADNTANIQTDHNPVWADMRLKFKATQKKNRQSRKKYAEIPKEEKKQWNTAAKKNLQELRDILTQNNATPTQVRMDPESGEVPTTMGGGRPILVGGPPTPPPTEGTPSWRNLSQQDRWEIIKQFNQTCTQTLPQKRKTTYVENYTSRTMQILEERKTAAKHKDIETFAIKDKEFRKSKQKDKRDYLIDTIKKELDIRDR